MEAMSSRSRLLAMATAASWDRTPSFRRIERMWERTVASDTTSSVAMSWADPPLGEEVEHPALTGGQLHQCLEPGRDASELLLGGTVGPLVAEEGAQLHLQPVDVGQGGGALFDACGQGAGSRPGTHGQDVDPQRAVGTGDLGRNRPGARRPGRLIRWPVPPHHQDDQIDLDAGDVEDRVSSAVSEMTAEVNPSRSASEHAATADSPGTPFPVAPGSTTSTVPRVPASAGLGEVVVVAGSEPGQPAGGVAHHGAVPQERGGDRLPVGDRRVDRRDERPGGRGRPSGPLGEEPVHGDDHRRRHRRQPARPALGGPVGGGRDCSPSPARPGAVAPRPFPPRRSVTTPWPTARASRSPRSSGSPPPHRSRRRWRSGRGRTGRPGRQPGRSAGCSGGPCRGPHWYGPVPLGWQAPASGPPGPRCSAAVPPAHRTALERLVRLLSSHPHCTARSSQRHRNAPLR